MRLGQNLDLPGTYRDAMDALRHHRRAAAVPEACPVALDELLAEQ